MRATYSILCLGRSVFKTGTQVVLQTYLIRAGQSFKFSFCVKFQILEFPFSANWNLKKIRNFKHSEMFWVFWCGSFCVVFFF